MSQKEAKNKRYERALFRANNEPTTTTVASDHWKMLRPWPVVAPVGTPRVTIIRGDDWPKVIIDRTFSVPIRIAFRDIASNVYAPRIAPLGIGWQPVVSACNTTNASRGNASDDVADRIVPFKGRWRPVANARCTLNVIPVYVLIKDAVRMELRRIKLPEVDFAVQMLNACPIRKFLFIALWTLEPNGVRVRLQMYQFAMLTRKSDRTRTNGRWWSM